LKLTMLFRLFAAISVRSTRQPPGCCVFSPSEPHEFGHQRVELVPSTAGDKQRYSFLISEWRRALSATVTRGFASLKLCRIPFLRPIVASAVEAAKLQSNPAPSRFRDCPTWYRVNTQDTATYNATTSRRFGMPYGLRTHSTSTRFLARWR
jgi:hypothetical protein